jgi:hypothetical protein
MNRKTLIKLKKFVLTTRNLSNTKLLEEYRKSNKNIDCDIEEGIPNDIEYDRNSILENQILRRMAVGLNGL